MPSLSRFRLPGALCLLLTVPHPAAAQSPTPLVADQTLTIKSAALNESRTLDISLPADYATGTQHYPVLVVLDGEFLFPLSSALARFYAGVSQLPPMIVVGVRNTHRNRDLTPKPQAGFHVPPEVPGAGGAESFLRFLSDELVPRIDHDFRTVPMRVLTGHSLGGLFGLYALGQRPGLFTGYLIMEPATWWNDEHELRAARTALARAESRRVRVIVVNGAELTTDTLHWGGDAPMVRRITVGNETHVSMPAVGMMTGLRRMFADFRPAEWRPGTRPAAMLDQIDSLSLRVGYDVRVEPDMYIDVIRMSINSREFDDAGRVLTRMEKTLGTSGDTRQLRSELATERARPVPADFVPLVLPRARPSAAAAQRFLGRWESADSGRSHWIEVTASGDTIVVHDWQKLGDGSVFEGDRQVIQLTAAGSLEWGLPVFRGIAALLVLQGRLTDGNIMAVSREVRGWSPVGPGPDLIRVDTLHRVRR